MTDHTTLPSPADDDEEDLDSATATLVALEDVLDAVRERRPDTTPQWEFCEGVMTALLCTRREIGPDEWMYALFGPDGADVFANPTEHTRFLMSWMERESQLRAALDAPVKDLNDEQALSPSVLDWRGMLATLPDAERAEAVAEGGQPPAFGQLWAHGFVFATDFWQDDWTPPRDKEIAAAIDEALDCLIDLAEDDEDTPTVNLYQSDGPPAMSEARFEAFGEALWAVYDLRDIARSLGPRLAPVRNDDKVGRNDPCPCGSGKKYKKCCGA